MSIEARDWAWQQIRDGRVPNLAAKVVLLQLAERVYRDDFTVTIGQRQLAERCGLDRRNMCRINLPELVSAGLITIESNGQRATYRLQSGVLSTPVSTSHQGGVDHARGGVIHTTTGVLSTPRTGISRKHSGRALRARGAPKPRTPIEQRDHDRETLGRFVGHNEDYRCPVCKSRVYGGSERHTYCEFS